ncbi:hypothetical protein NLG97_g2240 [Lecanicillium saksenae]|uniref:Uncharacterized protein n=1 Tax=Lecanicillium saksenae TaxID=468837 RepID=A0ACC1R3C3_9HYPO|nr:hypothetical protein NLG97_g2240 [Lecanicillium saksenae]
MAKKNRKKSKQQPSRPLYPPTDIEQDTRNIAARTTVLTTVDTLLVIFSHLPQSCLILDVQGTCQLWKEIVRRMPETFLENVPNVLPNEPSWPAYAAGYPHLAAYHGKADGVSPPWIQRFHPETAFTPSRWFNPILFHHFSCLYGVPDVRNARRRKAFLNLHTCYMDQGPSSRVELSCMTPYHLPAMGEFREAFKRRRRAGETCSSRRGRPAEAPTTTCSSASSCTQARRGPSRGDAASGARRSWRTCRRTGRVLPTSWRSSESVRAEAPGACWPRTSWCCERV